MTHPDPRYRRIWQTVAGIPPGRVASYGQVARQAGLPRGARLVGRALRLAPEGLPWHRVVNAQGRIALPPDSDGYREQRARLLAEGVTLRGPRVDLRRHGWAPDLDELLWRPHD